MSGLGRIYKQKRSKFWWYQIYVHGKPVRHSTGQTNERKARGVLRQMIERIGAGSYVPTESEVTFDEIAAAVVLDYQINKNRAIRNVKHYVVVLSGHFGGRPALDIRQAHIQAYIAARRADGRANATINRELAALRRMFSLAIEHEVLGRAPKIKLLKEDNVRTNFLQPADFDAIHVYLPGYLKDPLRWLYLCGGRKSEMVSLHWRDVGEGEVTIRGENTKNGRSRTIPLVGELSEIIRRARANRRLDCPFVFHRHGKTLGDFSQAWNTARIRAGYPGTWIHDFRRSAARNLVRTPGVSMHTAMAITGHITPSMFRRYDIQDMADVVDALTRTQERIAESKGTAKVKTIR